MSDTIKKAEVARVLAAAWNEELGTRRAGVQGGGGTKAMRPWLFQTVAYLADELNIRPEFESALAALEKEKASRG